MKMITEISLNKVQKTAEELYRDGFSCSESLLSAMLDCFELDIPREVIAMSSGFSAGMGNSGCVCGALSGGVMTLGIFFGRTELDDPKPTKNHELAKELHDYFKEETGKNVVCCRVLTEGLDMSIGEHKSQCVQFVGAIARKVAELIVRECQLTNLDEAE